jgi:hypothetical protein
MKSAFFYLFALFFLSVFCFSPDATLSKSSATIPTITINARLVGKDSVILPFNQAYYLTEDTCTEIMRYAHYSFENHTYFGKFKDVKKTDPSQIVAEGTYSVSGLMQGPFISNYLNGQLEAQGVFDNGKYNGDWVFHYPNGNLQAIGKFNHNNYVGKWETYYEDGKPELFFEVTDGNCLIENAWDKNNVQIVINGKGNYKTDPWRKNIWYGKIVNGKPDSAWTFESPIAGVATKITESFKDNEFIMGNISYNGIKSTYNDASHIVLSPNIPFLPITQAENMMFAQNSCYGGQYNNVYIKMFGKKVYVKVQILKGAKSYQ